MSVYDGALPQAALVPVEYYTHTADPPGQDIALQLQRHGNTQLQYYFCSLLQVTCWVLRTQRVLRTQNQKCQQKAL